MKLEIIAENGTAIAPEHDLVLITADGRSLHDDLRFFMGLQLEHDAYCVNRSIKAYPGRVMHWADVDANNSAWVAEHLEKNNPSKTFGKKIVKHTLGEYKGFDIAWDVVDSPWDPDDVLWHGSTALFAVLTAIEMGYKKIVLAGAPLDLNGHWYLGPEIKGPLWNGDAYRAWLDFSQQKEAVKVRSLSGYTSIILGRPGRVWLDELKSG